VLSSEEIGDHFPEDIALDPTLRTGNDADEHSNATNAISSCTNTIFALKVRPSLAR
jgi:hypothetical protein